MSGPDQKRSFIETRILNMLDQLKAVTEVKVFLLIAVLCLHHFSKIKGHKKVTKQ
jgi:hypothetical protein